MIKMTQTTQFYKFLLKIMLLTWSMPVFSLMLASGGRFGGLAVGLTSSEFLFPPNFPAPTTKVLNWLKATFSLFSSNVSTDRKYKILHHFTCIVIKCCAWFLQSTCDCLSAVYHHQVCVKVNHLKKCQQIKSPKKLNSC